MNIENITSDKMSLNYDGKTMQKKVYEDLLKEKDDELDQYKNNWEELKKYIGKEWYCFDNDSLEFEIAKSILNKMKELEVNKWK